MKLDRRIIDYAFVTSYPVFAELILDGVVGRMADWRGLRNGVVPQAGER